MITPLGYTAYFTSWNKERKLLVKDYNITNYTIKLKYSFDLLPYCNLNETIFTDFINSLFKAYVI